MLLLGIARSLNCAKILLRSALIVIHIVAYKFLIVLSCTWTRID